MSHRVDEGTSFFDRELQSLSYTYERALTFELEDFKRALAGASGLSVIAVGSGGSYTAASFLCKLHETYTGRVSRPTTPLELICNPTLASSSPVFLISAEGKNPDIAEAMVRARRHSARTLHVITNRSQSPLTEVVSTLTDINTHVFELEDKDGYLATNSLLMDSMLIARAYGELDRVTGAFPANLDGLKLSEGSVGEWVEQSKEFADLVASRGSIIVVYSPLLRPVAEDLESKLSEAALLHCQLCDLRSFAHGRHSWLAQRASDCAVIALTEPSLGRLWENMSGLFPVGVPKLTMSLAGDHPADLIAGLVAQMHLVANIARAAKKDIAKPEVPDFGRSLYYLNLKEAIPAPVEAPHSAEDSKFDVLGARWPSNRSTGAMSRSRADYQSSLTAQHFRAVVFDYDGTLCNSHRNDMPLTPAVTSQIKKLLAGGVVVGIASGRGGSIQENLTKVLDPECLSKVQLGLYNGGWIGPASEVVVPVKATSEFLSHVTRLMMRLQSIGVPIEKVKPTYPYQVSIRFKEGLATDQMWFVLADTLRQAGLDTSSMVRSKHSIDVLSPGVNKSRLVADIIQKLHIDPYDILTVGDQGAWPGNDASLLEHRFSLSVDSPSRRIDRGWKLAPSHKRDVDATLWYMEKTELIGEGRFRLSL